MKSHKLKKQKCPSCGRRTEAATCLESDLAPEPGDTSVCIGCQNIHVFDDELFLRAATAEELERIPLDVLSRTQRLLVEAKKTP